MMKIMNERDCDKGLTGDKPVSSEHRHKTTATGDVYYDQTR
jgi:hypothetical protein